MATGGAAKIIGGAFATGAVIGFGADAISQAHQNNNWNWSEVNWGHSVINAIGSGLQTAMAFTPASLPALILTNIGIMRMFMD